MHPHACTLGLDGLSGRVPWALEGHMMMMGKGRASRGVLKYITTTSARTLLVINSLANRGLWTGGGGVSSWRY